MKYVESRYKISMGGMENIFIDIVKMQRSVYNKEEKNGKKGIKEGNCG